MTKGIMMNIEYQNETTPPAHVVKPQAKYPVVYVFMRGEDGKRYVFRDRNFRPYFYVLSTLHMPFKEITEIQYRDEPGMGMLFKKIFVELPENVRQIRMILEKQGYPDSIFEADVLFIHRYLIDKGLRAGLEWDLKGWHPINETLNITPRAVFLDIEIYAEKTRDPGKIRAKEYILMCTLYDTYTQKYYTYYVRDQPVPMPEDPTWVLECVADEEQLILKVSDKLREFDPDIIAGYNVDFDLLHLRAQARKVQQLARFDMISPLGWIPKPRRGKKRIRETMLDVQRIKIPGRSVMDMLEVLLSIHKQQIDEYNLDYVSRKFLSPPDNFKLTLPDGRPIAPNIPEVWPTNPELVLRYNKRDVELCVRLDKEHRLFEFTDGLRKLAGGKFEDALSAKKLIDIEYLRRAKFPMPVAKAHSKKYPGAVVVQPKLMKYQWIIQLDYKQLYPTIMLTYNIDPDTWAHESLSAADPSKFYEIDGNFFRKTPQGVFPQMIAEFLKARDIKRVKIEEAKKANDKKSLELYEAESFALKSFINAVYGVLGYRFRKGAEACAKSVTFIGREMTMYAIETAIQLGYEVIYGDTDSIFVKAKSATDFQTCLAEAKILQKAVEDNFPSVLTKRGYNGPNLFHMAIDKIWSEFFTLDVKKRYAGYVEPYHEMKTVGLETRRSDSSKFAKGIQENVIKDILENIPKEELEKYLATELNKMDELPLFDIAVPSAITKDLDQYKRRDKKTGKLVDFNPVQKKAAIFSNRYLKMNLGAGDKPKRFYVKMENAPPEIQEKIDVIAVETPSQLPVWLKVDYPKMMALTVKKKIEKIILVAPYSIEWSTIPMKESLKAPPKVKKERKKKEAKVEQPTMLKFMEA